MSLKTSFFNKTLVKSDFKRLWWIPVLHTLGLFLMGTFPYIQRYYRFAEYPLHFVKDAQLTYTSIYNIMPPYFILACIVPVILAVMLFSYMQSGKASTFAHSIPVSRTATFISHLVSGILMFVIPLAINGAIFLIMRTNPGFAQTFYVSHLLQSLFIAFLYSIVAFSLSTIVAMITGNVIANIFFTYVFAVLPLIVEAFCKFFADSQLHGFVLDSALWCEKYLYLAGDDILCIYGIVFYLVLSAVFLAGAYLLYRARNMENHSEVVAFPVLRPVFVFSVAIVIGAVGYAYVQALFGVSNTWTMLPFGLIGLTIATMIVKKSFRRLKLLKPALIYTLLLACVFCVFHFDLTGFEGRVPDAEDVEYVTFEQNGINLAREGWYYDSDGKKYKYNNPFSPDIKDLDEIRAVTDLHSFLTGTEGAPLVNAWGVTISYKLKNGRTLLREYVVDYAEYQHLLEPIVTTDTIRKTYFPILRDNERKYFSVSVHDTRIADNTSYVPSFGDEAIIEEFLTALKADTANAPYEEFAGRNDTFTSVELDFRESATYEDGTAVSDDEIRSVSEIYYVRPSYVNTQAVIEKYALKVSLPKASDITFIGVDYYNMDIGERVTLQKINNDDKFKEMAFPYVIENSEEIAQVYDYCCTYGSPKSTDMHVEFFLENGHNFSCGLSSTSPDLPECLKNIVNP